MSTSELERRLGEVLLQHAEDAMNRTDTRTRLDTLGRRLEDDKQRRRRLWAAGSLAAAAAVVIAAVVVSIQGNGARDQVPAGPDQTTAPVDAVAVAGDFVDAYATNDADRVLPYLADGGTIQSWSDPQAAEGIRQDVRWSRAAGFQMIPGGCEERATSATVTEVACAFDYHALGSDQLQRGPYSDNEYSVTVNEDGEVVAAVLTLAFETNGFAEQMWEPFLDWVDSAHRTDAIEMYAPGTGMTRQATTRRADRLWEKYIAEYVAAVQHGEAD